MSKKIKTRKPTHAGIILEEHYIKPLHLKLDELTDNLGISRNSLYKIRQGYSRITADIALRLSKAFGTSPELWLNLQQKFDLWVLNNAEKPLKISQIYIPKAAAYEKKFNRP